MKKTIPAVTQVICDRCKAECDPILPNAVRFYQSARSQVGDSAGHYADYDLCRSCADRLCDFLLRSPFTTGETNG